MLSIKRACERCMAALPRPSSTLVPSFAATRDYYAARDTVDLERAELVRIISWTRKMAIKLTGMALLLGLLTTLTGPPCPPARRRHGLSALVSSANLNCSADMPGEMLWLNLLWDLGLAWHVLVAAVGAGSTVTAIQGCVANDGSASATAACVFGIASTIVTIGSAYQAMQAAGWRGEEDDAELHQRRLEAAIHHILGRSFGHDPELLGHVGHTHRLGRRDAQYYLHPRAPLFRFSHPALGLMDLAAREHANGTHFTLSPLRRPPPPDAAYDDVLDAVSCFAGGEWRDGHVLSVQMYDNTHHATFGYASLGILENGDADADLKAFGPTGMPLPVPDC
ncbi:hypothetical protein GTA08_BOTSDO12677 [Botryosphaeria dothidea]|uniref:Uncharacterized protein n=1 Tax=Botryosphaeria dothidea TaxID=55169 RepID=A0A8H4J212_9PEZI|nr:hypothetical protein GTA08_BOTSDO12677 [Botryosphaeria dothidea]